MKYRIRLQIIVTADDNGSNAAELTASTFAARVPTVNQVFTPAELEFVFDQNDDFVKINNTLVNREFTPLEAPNVGTDKWDHEPKVNTESHTEARTALAKQFPDKLVVIYRARKKFEKGDDGNWSIVNRGGGSSSSNAMYVNMSTSSNAIDLSHEIGHYLQLPHPFVGGITTVAEAAAKIKKYVEDGHDKDKGLSALDGDRFVILDTPSDCKADIFESENLEKCGNVGKITIPVNFGNESRNYILEPDRNLVMSYFKGCSQLGNKTISPQQARRVRDGLEMRNRHCLIDTKPSFSLKLEQGGTVTGGHVSELDVAMVRAGRVATVVRDGEGDLKVIVWDIEESGKKVTRRGDIKGGAVSKVSICALGQNMVATAVITSNQLKVILWQISENGTVTRLENFKDDEEVTDVACCICRYGLGTNFMATAVRRSDGKLKVSVFEFFASGGIRHRASVMAGEVNNPQLGLITPRLTIAEVGEQSLVTNVRLDTGELRAILWQFDADNKLTRLGDRTLNAPSVGSISACHVARELSVTAIQDSGKKLQLIAYAFPGDGKFITQKATASGGSITQVEICRVGTEMVVTGVKTQNEKLKLILWQVTSTGDHFVRLDDFATDQEFSQLSMCYSDRSQLVTTMRDSDGNVKLIAWNIKGPLRFVGNPGGAFDQFKTIIDSAKMSNEMSARFSLARGGECDAELQ
jgi:hypothetical protein